MANLRKITYSKRGGYKGKNISKKCNKYGGRNEEECNNKSRELNKMNEEILNLKKKYLEYHKLQQDLSLEISDLEENIDDLQEDYNQALIRESKFSLNKLLNRGKPKESDNYKKQLDDLKIKEKDLPDLKKKYTEAFTLYNQTRKNYDQFELDYEKKYNLFDAECNSVI